MNFSSPQAHPAVRTQPFQPRDSRVISDPAPASGAKFQLLDGLDVEVWTTNQQWMELAMGPDFPFLPLAIIPWPPGIIRIFRGTPAPPPLKVWLRVGPAAAADFDPMRMKVVLPDGVVVAPTSLIGELCAEFSECRGDLTSLPLTPVVVERSADFIVSFPTDASPQRAFTLRVAGFTRGGATAGEFDIQFKQATAWVLASLW